MRVTGLSGNTAVMKHMTCTQVHARYTSRNITSMVLVPAHFHTHAGAGWHKGSRRAVIMAGRKHPDHIHSSLTKYPDAGIVSDEDQLTFGRSPHIPPAQQVGDYKYIINVDGWCGSKRFKQLLASDSAILNMVSMEDEWYSPLLIPGKHYIPVRFEANDPNLDEGSELIDRIAWAQEHPDAVAKIVQHAKSFHAFYMSQRGEECYAVQMLEEYSTLLLDAWKLQGLVQSIATI